MKLDEIVKTLNLSVLTGAGSLDRIVEGGYVGDLLSDVMGNAEGGDLWITRQPHENIVAVATLKDLAGIILVQGKEPEKIALQKAEKESIPILVTSLSAFEISGKLHALLERS
ncbi:MAG: serine kinase [Deltaproteobacteria bacterium]|nr:serine kinase [Deltaproteobacteria bacterium]